ncbi:hypothetical protein E7V67_015900 [[Empedobacter] haloabium]|uniref:PH domain-containing protein n=1 Tax=[Empedobacter] haloabium TaxID=592317 RepID=A0ABZ1UEG6_9BURK
MFAFESADSLAQFTVWLIPFAGGGIVSILAGQWAGWKLLAALALICLLLIGGLRSSIQVFPDHVEVVRKWFFVPYKTYRSCFIEDVAFGGDWGLEEGAMGIVVRMSGQEIHLGTSKNMRYLYESLIPFVNTWRPPGHG